MPRRVTYGVSGLIDWHARIPVGRARVSVHFAGGALTQYGVTPAEFTTSDPLIQRVIENSQYYRSGRIKTLRSAGRDDTPALSRNNTPQAQDAYTNAVLPLQASPSADRVVRVSCLDDAIELLRTDYNVPSYLLTNRSSIEAQGASHGVTFEFDD